MPKIRELTQDEAARLREAVRARFMRQHTNGNAVRFATFKDAYDDLRKDILRVVPDKELSVSTTRLRKLFYYTDETVCPPEQLQKPSFGRDFIETLEQYIRDDELSKPSTLWTLTWKIGAALLILLVLASIASRIFRVEQPKSWRANFYETSMDSLRKEGFGWQDFDSIWWSKQLREGALTLYTQPGDYWVKPNEPRLIKNLIYKEVRGDCFSVILKVDDFDPQHNCEQVTLFLFDKRLSRETHLRAGISYWTPSKDDPGVQHTTTDYQEAGQVTQQGYYHFRNPANAGPPVKTFWLKVVYEDNKVSVFQKINHEWNMWGICAQPFDLRFKPAYVGIGAFQGWTENDGTPRNAPPIPVFVDYLQVESCD